MAQVYRNLAELVALPYSSDDEIRQMYENVDEPMQIVGYVQRVLMPLQRKGPYNSYLYTFLLSNDSDVLIECEAWGDTAVRVARDSVENDVLYIRDGTWSPGTRYNKGNIPYRIRLNRNMNLFAIRRHGENNNN